MLDSVQPTPAFLCAREWQNREACKSRLANDLSNSMEVTEGRGATAFCGGRCVLQGSWKWIHGGRDVVQRSPAREAIRFARTPLVLRTRSLITIMAWLPSLYVGQSFQMSTPSFVW